MYNNDFKFTPFEKSKDNTDSKIRELTKEINKLKKNYKEIKKKLNKTDNMNVKLTFNDISEHKKLLCVVTTVDTFDYAPILFTSKKIKVRIEKLEGNIEVIKSKESFFSLEDISKEHPFLDKKKQNLIIQGNINVFNIETGHMYSGLILTTSGTKYMFGNRPCVPLGIEFEGYIQINLLVSLSH
jgi:hypothetical protein